MEEDLGLGNLKPCLNPASNFPRRRPLRSRTYYTFVRILSHCNDLQSFSLPQIQDKLGDGIDPNALAKHNNTALDSSLVQKMSPHDGVQKFNAVQDGRSAGSEIVVDLLDAMDMMEQGNKEIARENNVDHVESSEINKLPSVFDNLDDLMSPRREQKAFCEPFVNEEVLDAVNGCPIMDVISDMPRPVESSIEKDLTREGNFSERTEFELQMKQRELEELISTTGNFDYCVQDLANGEIEEGEISGEIGADDQAVDVLIDNAVLLEEKKSDEVQASGDGERELINHDNGVGQSWKCDIRSLQFSGKFDGAIDIMKLETRSTVEEHTTNAKIFGYEAVTNYAKDHDTFVEAGCILKRVGGAEGTDKPVISLEKLAHRGQISYGDISENKNVMPAEMEAGVGKRKRSRMSKEQKAKKKKRDRIKRAEKNRKLGVKRLKLQPVLKPKKVEYCRHYLRGRCQEGEKCKYSHDTTPLTKSTPCTHFARHSCLKGDNCPFDHELSNYPCNNFVTKGICSRGANCLFSHEISSKNDPPQSSKLSTPELKSPSLKQVNSIGITNQFMPAKIISVDNASGKVVENKVPAHLGRPVANVPKGICFISPSGSTTANTSKHEAAAPYLMAGDGAKISNSMVSNLSNSIEKSKEVAKGQPLRVPKGINFLSFGKNPSDDSVKKEKRASESLLAQLTKNALSGLSPPSNGSIKIHSQTSQTSSEFAPVANKMADKVSFISTPPGMKFLSVGSISEDNPSNVGQLIIVPDNINNDMELDGLKFSSGSLHGSASSSLPHGRSSDQSGADNGGGKSSSSKTSLLLNAPSSAQRALQSTLAFAAKFDSEMKLDRPMANPFAINSHDSSRSRGL